MLSAGFFLPITAITCDHPIVITSGCWVALSGFINGVLSVARETFVQFLQLNELPEEPQKILATDFSCPYTS